eukprot:m.55662 g.55662  ORF g.55662 m.55662 type:complete len:73 (+) comp15547_c0_seq9:2218-2436(+)
MFPVQGGDFTGWCSHTHVYMWACAYMCVYVCMHVCACVCVILCVRDFVCAGHDYVLGCTGGTTRTCGRWSRI